MVASIPIPVPPAGQLCAHPTSPNRLRCSVSSACAKDVLRMTAIQTWGFPPVSPSGRHMTIMNHTQKNVQQATGVPSGSRAKGRPRGRCRATWEGTVSILPFSLQVRKSSQEVLLALLEQDLISQCDIEGKACPVLLERSGPDRHDDHRAEVMSISLPEGG